MKESLHYRALLLFLLLIVHSSILSASSTVNKQGLAEVKVNEITTEKSPEHMEMTTRSLEELMGQEMCGDGDGECFKRRMIAEAHLDYIYTQQHKP